MNKARRFSGANAYSIDGMFGQDVVVAVIDSGVAPHKDLDIVGGWSFDYSDPLEDEFGHGTAVAGIIAGAKYGIAQRAKILPVKIAGADGVANSDDVVAALDYVRRWGYEHFNYRVVINISLPNIQKGTKDVGAAVKELVGLCVPICVSSDVGVDYFASEMKEPLVVGGIDPYEKTALFNAVPEKIDVCQIGKDIWTCKNDPVSYRYVSGSNYACAIVSGMCACILSRVPYATEKEVYKELMFHTRYDVIQCKEDYYRVPFAYFSSCGFEEVDMIRQKVKVRDGLIEKQSQYLPVRLRPDGNSGVVAKMRMDYCGISARTRGNYREVFVPEDTRSGRLNIVVGWVSANYIEDVVDTGSKNKQSG